AVWALVSRVPAPAGGGPDDPLQSRRAFRPIRLTRRGRPDSSSGTSGEDTGIGKGDLPRDAGPTHRRPGRHEATRATTAASSISPVAVRTTRLAPREQADTMSRVLHRFPLPS